MIAYRIRTLLLALGLVSMTGPALAAGPGTTNGQAVTGVSQAPPIQDLVGPLRDRLEQDPADVDSWVLLGRSYQYLGRSAEADAAFARARALGYSGPAPVAASAGKPLDPIFEKWISERVQQP
jgi:cytochrome c-type biogenesis protein CcmH